MKRKQGEKSILSQERESVSDMNKAVYQTRKKTRSPVNLEK